MDVRLTTLPTGLRIATCEIPHAETAAMGIWAGVGGRHEPANLNGISHFIEHMLFKGTSRRSARRIMEEVEGSVAISTRTPRRNAHAIMLLLPPSSSSSLSCLCDLYMNPRFALQDIERERGVICEEILMYRDEPSSHVQEILNGHFWPNHPLGRPLTGTPDTVESLQRDDLLSYRASHYHAGSTVVSSAGKIRHQEVIERASKLLEKIPPRQPIRQIKAPDHSGTTGVISERRDVQQTQVALGLPGASHHDPRRYALQILTMVLGGNASSRLFQELRERRGLCYSISAHPSSFKDAGMLNISLGLEQRNVEKSLRLILSTFENLKRHVVRPAELKRAKEYAVGTSRMSLERTSSQNMRVGGSVLVYGKIIDPEEVHSRLRAVTGEEVQAAANEFLDPLRATVAIVGPAPDEAAIRAFCNRELRAPR